MQPDTLRAIAEQYGASATAPTVMQQADQADIARATYRTAFLIERARIGHAIRSQGTARIAGCLERPAIEALFESVVGQPAGRPVMRAMVAWSCAVGNRLSDAAIAYASVQLLRELEKSAAGQNVDARMDGGTCAVVFEPRARENGNG